jgi:hypothetical protein
LPDGGSRHLKRSGITGWPPLAPPEPSEIILIPRSASSGMIARDIPVSSRCESVVGARMPSSVASCDAMSSDAPSSEASYSPGFELNGKACQCTSRALAATLKAPMADAFGHWRSGEPFSVGPPQPSRPDFSQSSRKLTSQAFVRYVKGVSEPRSSAAVAIARGMNVSMFSCSTQYVHGRHGSLWSLLGAMDVHPSLKGSRMHHARTLKPASRWFEKTTAEAYT